MIKVFGSNVDEEELAQVYDSIKNQWLGAGPKLEEFEKKFSEKINTTQFMMIDNASNGLFLAVTLLNLPAGSEVILPSFTWISCAHAITMCGLKPVFCDVEIHTQNVTAELIAQHITPKTRAIMVVHYAGLPVDMDPILDLGFPVIEDTAHAVDSMYKGKHCGTIGDMGVFSFDSMKNLAVGEGGGFTCNNKATIERAKRMRLCGMGTSAHQQIGGDKERWWEQEPEEAFIKMKPSDIAAGFAIAQLEKLDKLQAKRKDIWYTYQNELAGYDNLTLPVDVKESGMDRHSYFTFLIQTPKRNELARYLYDNGVYTTMRFFPIHLMKMYKIDARLKNTEILNESALNIPLHPKLSENEIAKVIDKISTFLTKEVLVKC